MNLVGADQVTMKGRAGLDVETVPRDVAFRSHALLAENILTVPDLAQDPRFADNPLVGKGPQFRFYAGTPLISPRDGPG